MTKLKFRAWHNKAKQMLLPEKNSHLFQWVEEGQDIEVMQWTGVNDVIGYPVFKSDICEMSYGDRFVVVFNEGSFTGKMDGSFLLGNRLPGSFKVIGNIYQNPELLNVEKQSK